MPTEAVVLRVMIGVPAEDIFNDSISTAEFSSRVRHVALVLIIIPSVRVYNALPQRVVCNNYWLKLPQHGHNVT